MRRYILGTAIAAALSLSFAAPVHAGPGSDKQSGDIEYPITPEEQEDIDLAARGGDDSRMLDDPTAYAWQPSFVELMSEIRENHPDDVAGVNITAITQASTTVYFKGTAPTDAESALSAQFPQVSIVENIGYSEKSLTERTTDVHYYVLSRSDVATADSYYDTDTGTIHVTVDAAATLNSTQRAALAADIASNLPPTTTSFSYDIVVDNTSASVDFVNIWGGGWLETQGTSGLQCTSGFTVQRLSDGLRGMSTASHCPDSLTWEAANGGTETTLYFTGGHLGSYGDMQWHTSTASETRAFIYSSGGATRSVTSVGVAVQGQQMCNFGQTTGHQTCLGTVYRTNVCQGTACRLMAMSGVAATYGDSGGPWFWGTVAYGLTKGSMPIDNVQRGTWSQVTYTGIALGVKVSTT